MHSLLPLSRPHQLAPDWEALAIFVLLLLLNILAFTVAFGVYHLYILTGPRWRLLTAIRSTKGVRNSPGVQQRRAGILAELCMCLS